MSREPRDPDRDDFRCDAEALSAYLDGELSPAECSRVEEALAEDPALAAHFAELEEISRTLRTLPTLRAPERVLRGVRGEIAPRRPSIFGQFGAAQFGAWAALALISLTAVIGMLGEGNVPAPDRSSDSFARFQQSDFRQADGTEAAREKTGVRARRMESEKGSGAGEDQWARTENGAAEDTFDAEHRADEDAPEMIAKKMIGDRGPAGGLESEGGETATLGANSGSLRSTFEPSARPLRVEGSKSDGTLGALPPSAESLADDPRPVRPTAPRNDEGGVSEGGVPERSVPERSDPEEADFDGEGAPRSGFAESKEDTQSPPPPNETIPPSERGAKSGSRGSRVVAGSAERPAGSAPIERRTAGADLADGASSSLGAPNGEPRRGDADEESAVTAPGILGRVAARSAPGDGGDVDRFLRTLRARLEEDARAREDVLERSRRAPEKVTKRGKSRDIAETADAAPPETLTVRVPLAADRTEEELIELAARLRNALPDGRAYTLEEDPRGARAPKEPPTGEGTAVTLVTDATLDDWVTPIHDLALWTRGIRERASGVAEGGGAPPVPAPDPGFAEAPVGDPSGAGTPETTGEGSPDGAPSSKSRAPATRLVLVERGGVSVLALPGGLKIEGPSAIVAALRTLLERAPLDRTPMDRGAEQDEASVPSADDAESAAPPSAVRFRTRIVLEPVPAAPLTESESTDGEARE